MNSVFTAGTIWYVENRTKGCPFDNFDFDSVSRGRWSKLWWTRGELAIWNITEWSSPTSMHMLLSRLVVRAILVLAYLITFLPQWSNGLD